MSVSPETGSARLTGSAPRVTVIIATYNRSGPLHFAVSPVLAQTFDDIELLVIGDACTDDCETIVLEFSDPRVVAFATSQAQGALQPFEELFGVGADAAHRLAARR